MVATKIQIIIEEYLLIVLATFFVLWLTGGYMLGMRRMGRFQLGKEVFDKEWDAIYNVFAFYQLLLINLQNKTDTTIKFKVECLHVLLTSKRYIYIYIYVYIYI